jgi:hypothetical protein
MRSPRKPTRVDVESEGRSLSLRLRPGGYEVVQAVEASKPAP